MATSGSYDWNLTRNQIIRMAGLECHAIGAGIEMDATMHADFNIKLNAMVKAWQASGIHLWTTQEATLFPQVNQIKYQLGGTSPPDHATETYYSTTISAAEASGQTTISVTSSADMTVADNIGIVVDDGTLHWSTISSIPDSTSVVIDDALDDTAAAGNKVYNYTTKIVRPLKVVHARRYGVADDNETEIDVIARLDYNRLTLKNQAGIVNQIFYDPGRDTGYLYLYFKPSDVTNLVNFTWHRPIQDFDAAGDNPDLPQEWIMALAFNLAESMLAQFPVEGGTKQVIVGLAAKYLDLASGFDREEASVFFQPDMSMYG